MTRFHQINFEFDLRQAAQDRRISELEASQHADWEIIAHLEDQVVERELAYEHLEGAIASSRRVGAAIGIVMAVMTVTEDGAFVILSTISRRQDRELRLVADDIVAHRHLLECPDPT